MSPFLNLWVIMGNMNYKEARQYIKSRDALGIRPGLDNINELLKRLGNPEKDIPAVHIAGTNGKGSIMAFVEETLVRKGLKVGRYISPTIIDYRERWLLNKEMISEEKAAEILTAVKKVADEMDADFGHPTAFEIETAAAFYLFKEEACDVMLIECGMGGEGDATNVLGPDTVNVLASVSFDHMQFLGNTIQEITRQKLGIVRPGSVLISSVQCEEVYWEVLEFAKENDVELAGVYDTGIDILEESPFGSKFKYCGKEYEITLGGQYQIFNALTAIEVLNHLDRIGIKPSYEEIKKGLYNTVWQGRFSVMKKEPLVIVDGAHNRDAWVRLRESVDKYFTNRKCIYIIGVLKDKEWGEMVRLLSPTAKIVYTVTPDSPRALEGAELRDAFKKAGVDSEVLLDQRITANSFAEKAAETVDDASEENPQKAVMKIIDEAASDDVIIICGTLTITGEMIRCLS